MLLTTQYLEEADQLADRIAVIDHGTVIAEGTPSQLKASGIPGTVRVRLADPAQRPEAGRLLTRLLGAPAQALPDRAALTIRLPAHPAQQPAARQVAAAITGLTDAGISVSEFGLGQPSLDEVFLALTGQPVPGRHSPMEESS